METTSNMDAAVEQLLQVPDTPSEGNLDASVDEILEPTQDESEEIETAEAEDADNELELDAEYDDDDHDGSRRRNHHSLDALQPVVQIFKLNFHFSFHFDYLFLKAVYSGMRGCDGAFIHQ